MKEIKVLTDILGIEPIADVTKEVVLAGLKGVSAFLNAVFKPGMEELGSMLKDEVRYWRLKNIISILKKAERKLQFDGKELQIYANARVGLEIIEEGSKIDDPELQEIWAGLFASSCTKEGKDDSNIIFVDILKRLSQMEARILKYACENCKTIETANLIMSENLEVSTDVIKDIAQTDDIVRIDRELDHLLSLSLIHSGVLWEPSGGIQLENGNIKSVVITPTALALNLYYKTNAVEQSPKEFWTAIKKKQ